MRIFIALIAAAATIGLAGCNTVEGFGKDVKTAGGKIEKAAERHK